VPEALLAVMVKRTVVDLDFVTLQVAPAAVAAHPPPVHVYEVGPLVQFALMVVCCPIAGEVGVALGAHTGTRFGAVTQVTVWVGGVPETVKLEHAGFV
jgi:hypothetical protein